MNADRLLANYERIADAPDAIIRLRQFILDLSVRGKLVPQKPEDEPASALLKRIAKEKARLGETGKFPKERFLSHVDDAPFPIPRSWCWTRLGTITSYIQRWKRNVYAAADSPRDAP